MERLTPAELKDLITSVFSPSIRDKRLLIMVDVPDKTSPDNLKWQMRRSLAADWFHQLKLVKDELHFEQVDILYYQNVHNNNADLPEIGYFCQDDPAALNMTTLKQNGVAVNFAELLSKTQLVIAPTQFSATAPLKLLAKQHQFRAATMPGFSPEMIPALRLDYNQINQRVTTIKQLLDDATAMDIIFSVASGNQHQVHFDLRFRSGHASGGRFPDAGTAGNLPSGESYIVPYEGETGEKSESSGVLPVQFEDEIVLYQIEENIAQKVISSGRFSVQEAQKIQQEPAYGNIAEIGFGVLKDFGVNPTGEILLDEKLGLHIAFGRSDHFGGRVGVADFTSPENVVHIDRIYIPETQDQVIPEKVSLTFDQGQTKILMENNNYTIF
ncbi:MAG TPA: hypothetical protein ENN22_04820 [bacterium]|nr:hypothetical protein [bacterium]